MPEFYPPYVFGMHNRGGEGMVLGKNRSGWVSVTEAIGGQSQQPGILARKRVC